MWRCRERVQAHPLIRCTSSSIVAAITAGGLRLAFVEPHSRENGHRPRDERTAGSGSGSGSGSGVGLCMEDELVHLLSFTEAISFVLEGELPPGVDRSLSCPEGYHCMPSHAMAQGADGQYPGCMLDSDM